MDPEQLEETIDNAQSTLDSILAKDVVDVHDYDFKVAVLTSQIDTMKMLLELRMLLTGCPE